MEKIFSFSDFSALYEEDGENTESKIYEQNLKIILSDLLSLYYEMTDYGAYTDSELDSDFQSIVAGNSLENKIEALKNIISKAKQKALATDKVEGAKELIAMIDSAYNKYLEALKYITNKYKDSPDESAAMVNFINNFLDQIDESNFNLDYSEQSQIFEGKKSLLSDAENTINTLRGKIDSYKIDEDPRKKKFATDADLEIVKISNSVKGLRDKKNRDIEKSEIEKIFNDLTALETKFDTGINKIIDENTTDAELERLRNKARDVKDQIISLRNAYLKNKSAAEEKVKSEKIKVSLGKDYIDYIPEETKNSNPEVKKFQELVIDSFKNIKSVTDLPFYQKMGTDGKFGPNTRDMVKFLKGAFGLSDKSGDITKELSDEIQIQKDTIKESVSARVYDFSSFVNVSEGAFNLAAGLEVAKNLPTYKSKSSGSSSAVASKQEVKEAEGSAFNKKSAEEKWSWLTKKYISGSKPGNTKIKLGEEYSSSGKKYWKIVWEGWKESGFDVVTICSYPEGSNLGTYIDVIYPDGKNQFKLEDGKWGNKINPENESNWLPTNKYTYTKEIVLEKKENIRNTILDVISALSGATEDEDAFVNTIRSNIKNQKDLDDANALLKKLRIGPVALRKKIWKGKSIEDISNEKSRSLDNSFYVTLQDLAKDYLDVTDNSNINYYLKQNGFVPSRKFSN